jgi:hypothetical protein
MKGGSAMIRGRQADSACRRQRVIKAINDASGHGGEISVSAIARAAVVGRTFLCRHPDLLAQVHAASCSFVGALGEIRTSSSASTHRCRLGIAAGIRVVAAS